MKFKLRHAEFQHGVPVSKEDREEVSRRDAAVNKRWKDAYDRRLQEKGRPKAKDQEAWSRLNKYMNDQLKRIEKEIPKVDVEMEKPLELNTAEDFLKLHEEYGDFAVCGEDPTDNIRVIYFYGDMVNEDQQEGSADRDTTKKEIRAEDKDGSDGELRSDSRIKTETRTDESTDSNAAE